jgi:hypothetical protein
MRLLQNAIRKTVEGRAKIILVVVLFGVAVIVGWQVVSCELANVELRSDLRDLAGQVGDKIGLNAPSTDDDLRSAFMRKANRLQIQLEPDQVTAPHKRDHGACLVSGGGLQSSRESPRPFFHSSFHSVKRQIDHPQTG